MGKKFRRPIPPASQPKNEEQAKALQAQKDLQERKKKFIRESIMPNDRLVVFSGGFKVSNFGFNSDGDFLFFMLEQIYAWDGTNAMFQNLLKKIQEMNAPKPPEQPQDDLDELFAEQEAAKSEEESEEEEDAAQEQVEADAVAEMNAEEEKPQEAPISLQDAKKAKVAELRKQLEQIEEDLNGNPN